MAHSAKLLGAGRDKKSDPINYGAGISLKKKVGDFAYVDDVVMELYFDEISEDKLKQAIEIAKKSFKISSQKVEKLQLIF